MTGTDAHWTELTSQNERLADAADLPPTAAASGTGPTQPAHPAGRHHRRVAAVAMAGAVAMTGAGAAAAGPADAVSHGAPAPLSSWQIVKRVHDGVFGQFTAVTAVGSTGGWAFSGITRPHAFQRSGTTWTRAAFPGKSGESVIAAGASSARNVWAFTVGGKRSRALKWNGTRWSVRRSFSRQIGGAVVLGRHDVWVFGQPFSGGPTLGSWHYDGRSWTHVTSGHGLQGGSALSASSVWAFGGRRVAHWNGTTWTRTSVQALLPVKVASHLNDPHLTGIYAQSATSVWAVGDGSREDEGGPLVVLHYNGHSWRRVARRDVVGYPNEPQVASDGQGGLYIPVGPSAGGTRSHLVYYHTGQLAIATLPVPNNQIDVEAVAAIPGNDGAMLAVGYTHSAASLGSDVVSVILEDRN